MSDQSEDNIPTDERKWNDISACRYVKGYALESRISKLVMKLVRHLDLADRESDGAVHWTSMGPQLRPAFQQESGYTFSDSQWLDERSNKTLFQFSKNSNDVLLYIRAIQGHTGGLTEDALST